MCAGAPAAIAPARRRRPDSPIGAMLSGWMRLAASWL